MADTCIVCLGDLAGGGSSSRRSSLAAPPLGESGPDAVLSLAGLDDNETTTPHNDTTHVKQEYTDELAELDPSTAIAHLLPCGHSLHNECLKPWTERANSCPICRILFREVELKARVNGPTLDSYVVQDKKQEAEIDPSMIIDEDLFDEPAIEPCIICEQFGSDDDLLLCDGCNASCHTYCTGLNAVPAGPWFCMFCAEDDIRPSTPPARSSRHAHRERRGRQARTGSRNDPHNQAWARVWQSVWDRLNLDLDFPFDDEVGVPQRTDTQRRDFAQWQQRFHIAERLGGAARFRDTATTLLERPLPQPESQDELRAWNAFDKAKELQDNDTTVVQSPTSRKRKSAPASPADTAPEPERRLKRPRTRRAQELADASSDAGHESSTSTRRMSEPGVPAPAANARGDAGSQGPSFFQSLLKEVQHTPTNSITRLNRQLDIEVPTATDYLPPGLGSPASSPTTSNHPSPRLRPTSPPPNYHSRPSSPPPLTSRIEPIYALPSQHSPLARPTGQSDSEDSPTELDTSIHRGRRKDKGPAFPITSDLSSHSSPPRTKGISLATKTEIRDIVKAELKPIYKSRLINTDEYTDINKHVSHLLYGEIGKSGYRIDEDEDENAQRDEWTALAAMEVAEALRRLGKSMDDPPRPRGEGGGVKVKVSG